MNPTVTTNQKSIQQTKINKRGRNILTLKKNHAKRKRVREERVREEQKKNEEIFNKITITMGRINSYFKYKWNKCSNQKT